ncbi:MAG: hypothetical protein JXR88_12470 [Clostridia bacterium]|nr:hypothetical protein [Clostridia bacterium]
MITWKYTGEPVRAKMGYSFDFLEMKLFKITRHKSIIIKIDDFTEKSVTVKLNRLTFLDKTGTQYHTYIRHIEFIMPDQTIPTENIYKLMNIEDGDYTDET